jgi:hypothetical protein
MVEIREGGDENVNHLPIVNATMLMMRLAIILIMLTYDGERVRRVGSLFDQSALKGHRSPQHHCP